MAEAGNRVIAGVLTLDARLTLDEEASDDQALEWRGKHTELRSGVTGGKSVIPKLDSVRRRGPGRARLWTVKLASRKGREIIARGRRGV